MRIIEIKPRFHPETGKPCGTIEKTLHHRCDYCGKILHSPDLTMHLDYGECVDTCFGSDGDEFAFAEEYNVDIYPLLNRPYCFCNFWNNEGVGNPLCEQGLALEFLASKFSDVPKPCPPDGMLPLNDIQDLQAAFRAARVRAAKKLLTSGEVTPEELGLEAE